MELIYLLFTLTNIVLANMKIYFPQSLITSFSETNGEIKYSISNFGIVPYGRRISGYLDLANPIEACQSLNSSQQGHFVLIKRGNCTFVTKVRNAQNAGYQLAIIEDDKDEIITNFKLADDGTGYAISIPSVFISKSDGGKLTKYLEKAKNDSSLEPIQLLIKFDVQQTELVDVLMAFSITDEQTYTFLNEFQYYYDLLQNEKVNYTIMYSLYQMRYITTKYQYRNCIENGRYCAQDPDGIGQADGKTVIQETLRELCIYNQNVTNWFLYMNSFHNLCTKPENFDDCSLVVQRDLQIDSQKIEKCIREQQTEKTTDEGQKYIEHQLLEDQLLLQKNAGVQQLPAIVINQQDYLGRLTAFNVFSEICNSFLVTPNVCGNYVDDYYSNENDGTSTYLIVGIIIGVGFLLFGIFLFIYTRLAKRQFREYSETHVNEMVTHYIKMYETKEINNKQKDAI